MKKINLDKDLKKGEISEEDLDEVLENPIYLDELGYLPSFSFNKGEKPKAKEGQEFQIKIRGKYYSFTIHEGAVCELTHSHSIYYTAIENFKEIESL
jgi:nicotinic acid phosphoribosyltransferase